MGTEIELKIGDVSLDYAKNWIGTNYGYLFQAGDQTRRRSDAINYDYYADHPEELHELEAHEQALVRPLAAVRPRLNLLGHTLDAARQEYAWLIEKSSGIAAEVDPEDDSQELATFEEFCELVNRHPVATLNSATTPYEADDREERARGRFLTYEEEIARLPFLGADRSYWSESSYVASRLCILSPLAMLQVFALNPANLDAEVVWQYGPIVHAGWVDATAFTPGARRNQTILVATEGASDAQILRRSFDLLRPDVADFFRFIDGQERHHFWGTGNLLKFAEGLLRIDIQNSIVFLLDNDAEGTDAHRKLLAFDMPGNMRAAILPDLEEFRSFPALGPDGMTNSDINGRAAAIECFLDLRLPGYAAAKVIWSNLKKESGEWQGALDYKDSYTRHFLNCDDAAIVSGSYDTSKLTQLLDALIDEAAKIVPTE